MVVEFPICTQTHRSWYFRVSSRWAFSPRAPPCWSKPRRGRANHVTRPSFHGESLRDVKKRAQRGRFPALIRSAAAAVRSTSARSRRTLHRSLSKQGSNNRSLRRRRSAGHQTVCNLGVGMADLLRLLLQVAEKAANVARVCRQEAPLFQLLVQEKTGDDKNKKFVQDFKTLADVVIQEMIRHDVGAQFPEMLAFIHGEESNKFENGHGESVTVTVCSTEGETAALLASVLDNNHTAASLLARAIHRDPVTIDAHADAPAVPLNPSDLGIWIDPIDATSQYIEGREEVLEEGHLCPSGLHCALVLIGVYLRSSGEPVMGVINQPFYSKDPASGSWSGRHFWGVSYGGVNACSESRPKDVPDAQPSAVLSSSEKQVVKEALAALCGPGKLMYASGAGFKILCVIQGLADVYVLSEGSTFKWDSCAPHALLRALGGGVADLAQSLREGPAELTYHQPCEERRGAERWANHGGLLAYRDQARLHAVIRTLRDQL